MQFNDSSSIIFKNKFIAFDKRMISGEYVVNFRLYQTQLSLMNFDIVRFNNILPIDYVIA